MPDGELKEILVELVDLIASLDEEIRSLQVLTTHRVDHSIAEKLGIPQKSNALYVRARSLREKLTKFQY
jgi:hypothetical protein